MVSASLRRGALAAALISATGLLITTPAAAEPAAPHIVGTSTEPVYDYATAVRESVWVTTDLDNDGDGAPDTITVDLIRPREAAEAGVKVPVIMDSSPYYQCCGRGNESELKEYASDGSVTKFPLFYDNYFVPRGYAFAAVDFAGTSRSTGCGDVGGREEIEGSKAVVDWLNGRAEAKFADGTPAVADWTTGVVGMIGKSWDGSVANGVAATGVEGLATIVPIAGISSWYDYYREGGVPYYPNGPAGLAANVGGRPAGVCDALYDQLRTGADDATGNYNDFWAERDFRPDAGKVSASVFMVHGVNDLNVETKHFSRWWDELAANDVPRKIWLSQRGHVDPFDFRRAEWVETLHRWFDFWLQGLDNGIMDEPQASIERAPDQWVDEAAWPADGVADTAVPLGAGDGTTGTLGPLPAAADSVSIVDNPQLSESAAVSDPNAAVDGRRVFLSEPLKSDLRLSGTPTVTLRIKVDKPTTELTARLVEYGSAARINYLGQKEGIVDLTTESCYGESTDADDACYQDTAKDVTTSDLATLSRGWVDAAHRDSLTTPEPLQPGEWYTVTWPLRAHDAVLAKGRVLGLVLTLSDTEFTSPTSTGATVEVDLAGSSLHLPLAGTTATTHLPAATAVPQVTATAPQPATPIADRWRNFR